MRLWNSVHQIVLLLTQTDLIDPGTYSYYNACWQADQNPPVWRAGEYNTDIVADAALEFLDEASKSDRPFFLGVAPIAPHTEVEFMTERLVKFIPPIPAKRHEGLFPDAKIPRGPSFNPEEVRPSPGFLSFSSLMIIRSPKESTGSIHCLERTKPRSKPTMPSTERDFSLCKQLTSSLVRWLTRLSNLVSLTIPI